MVVIYLVSCSDCCWFLTKLARVIKAWSWFLKSQISKHFLKKWYPAAGRPLNIVAPLCRRKFSIVLLFRTKSRNLGSKGKLAVHLSLSALGGWNSTFRDLVCLPLLHIACNSGYWFRARIPKYACVEIGSDNMCLYCGGKFWIYRNRFKQPCEPL